jgi:hypothetical protein
VIVTRPPPGAFRVVVRLRARRHGRTSTRRFTQTTTGCAPHSDGS